VKGKRRVVGHKRDLTFRRRKSRHCHLHRGVAFAAQLHRADAEDAADTAREPLDHIAIIDIDGRRDPAFVGKRLCADGSQSKTRDTRLVEQAAECGMHIAGTEFETKHGPDLLLPANLYWQYPGLLFLLSG